MESIKSVSNLEQVSIKFYGEVFVSFSESIKVINIHSKLMGSGKAAWCGVVRCHAVSRSLRRSDLPFRILSHSIEMP